MEEIKIYNDGEEETREIVKIKANLIHNYT